VDYPDFAHPVAERVETGKAHFGILICGTANGVAMAANKHEKVRAAIAWNKEIAELAMACTTMPIYSVFLPVIYRWIEAKEMVDVFLETQFEGGRHSRRVEKFPADLFWVSILISQYSSLFRMNFDRKDLTNEELIRLYQRILKPRVIEERMLKLLRQGRVSKWFSGIGQEAISVGVTAALHADEYVCPLHRNLGVFTTRDCNLQQLFEQFQGKQNGFSQGRERSFHFGTNAHHIVGMISISARSSAWEMVLPWRVNLRARRRLLWLSPEMVAPARVTFMRPAI
jgi:RpiB/LacA/LacB family sugar-phosphate isomerase